MKKNENNIENYLIWEYLETPKKMKWENYQSNWEKSWGGSNKWEYGCCGIFINFIDKIYNIIQSKLFDKLYSKKKCGKLLFFAGTKYKNILIETKKHYSISLPVSGVKDRLFCIKYFMSYFSINKYRKLVYKYVNEKKVKHLYKLIDLIEIDLVNVKPKFIILGNDSLPLERALILVSKKIGIPTMVIQHGHYTSNLPLGDGKMADYILVWGKHFKDLYIESGLRKPDDLYILGYPVQIEKNNAVYKENNKHTVCYLGQKWEKYSNVLFEEKIYTIKKVNDVCSKLGIDFIYRPHPGEDTDLINNKISHIKFTQKGEKLIDTIKKNEIFISFNSTALVEAFMHSKICIQLLSISLSVANFEKLGICNKTFEDIKELENYLRILANSNSEELNNFRKKFNNDYIDITHEPSKRFLEILEDIKNKTNSQLD